MIRSAKLEHTMGVARTRLLLYNFVGFAPNAIASLFHGSANALQTHCTANALHCKRTANADGRRWSAVAAPCSLCESAMETITLNANAVQAR